jgi:hypothetical protein
MGLTRRNRERSPASVMLGVALAVLVTTGCHHSNEISAPWASLAGTYRADFNLPCGARNSADVVVTQQGSSVSAAIPGFGHIECTAAPAGELPRVTAAAVTLDVGCGSTNVTYRYLPTDDGRVLRWFFPDGRGENCGCGGTTSVSLELTPE